MNILGDLLQYLGLQEPGPTLFEQQRDGAFIFELDGKEYNPTEAEQELEGHTEDITPYPYDGCISSIAMMEEFHHQEALGINSWLDAQPDSLGVRMIRAYGYNHTRRRSRPSLIYKNILKELEKLAGEQKVDTLVSILKDFKVNPHYFIEKVESFKYKS